VSGLTSGTSYRCDVHGASICGTKGWTKGGRAGQSILVSYADDRNVSSASIKGSCRPMIRDFHSVLKLLALVAETHW
jgi:hypothetical protein